MRHDSTSLHSRSRFPGGRAVILCILILTSTASTWAADTDVNQQPASACTQIVLAGMIGANWDIFVYDTTQDRVLNLTHSADDERDPVWSPDGGTIAFAARRNQNWDIYAADLTNQSVRRMTDHSAYDGQPAWSPDGQWITFASYRDGNLEIYRQPAAGGTAQRITNDPGADAEPIWTPNGKAIIFSSWRSGHRQLYQLDLIDHSIHTLTEPGEEAHQPALSADGRYLAYMRSSTEGTHLVLRDFSNGTLKADRGSVQYAWPFWHSGMPAFSQAKIWLFSLQSTGVPPFAITPGWKLVRQNQDPEIEETDPSFPHLPIQLPGQWQKPMCAPENAVYSSGLWQSVIDMQVHLTQGKQSPVESPYGLAVLPDIEALQPRLAATVADSFQGLRQQTLNASGHDFLGVLNDAWRGLDHPYAGCLSWHKTGRAFDVRDWYAPENIRSLFIQREDLNGYTYFRIYLRTEKQDGSQGVPLHGSVWETTGRLGDPYLLQAGGQALPPPSGYFIDFTDLAEREGWTRIPALTPPHGDWRRNYLDLEFWHYERRDGLSWYEAMLQIYDKAELQKRFTPDQVQLHGYTTEEMIRAGIPGVLRYPRCLCTWN